MSRPALPRARKAILTKLWLRALFWLLWGFRSHGKEHVPREGPFLLASNHQSYLDPILVHMGQDRGVSFMAMEPLFRNRVFAALLRWWGGFPVDLERRDVRAMRTAMAQLGAGRGLVVFPEAGRSRDGRLMPMREGVAQLALHAGAPIVPVRIDGIFEIWPPQRFLPKLTRPLHVHYGPPIHPPAGKLNGVARRKAMAELMEAVGAFLEDGSPESGG